MLLFLNHGGLNQGSSTAGISIAEVFSGSGVMTDISKFIGPSHVLYILHIRSYKTFLTLYQATAKWINSVGRWFTPGGFRLLSFFTAESNSSINIPRFQGLLHRRSLYSFSRCYLRQSLLVHTKALRLLAFYSTSTYLFLPKESLNSSIGCFLHSILNMFLCVFAACLQDCFFS